MHSQLPRFLVGFSAREPFQMTWSVASVEQVQLLESGQQVRQLEICTSVSLQFLLYRRLNARRHRLIFTLYFHKQWIHFAFAAVTLKGP